MMLFVNVGPPALARYLDMCAPDVVTAEEAIAYFRSFLLYQDDRWCEYRDACEQGITVDEMRMRHARDVTRRQQPRRSSAVGLSGSSSHRLPDEGILSEGRDLAAGLRAARTSSWPPRDPRPRAGHR